MFSVKIIKGHHAVRQHMLQGFLLYLDTLFLWVSSKMGELSASVCSISVYIFLDSNVSRLNNKFSQMNISTAKGGGTKPRPEYRSFFS